MWPHIKPKLAFTIIPGSHWKEIGLRPYSHTFSPFGIKVPQSENLRDNFSPILQFTIASTKNVECGREPIN